MKKKLVGLLTVLAIFTGSIMGCGQVSAIDTVITSGSGLIKLVNEGNTVVVDYREHPEFWQGSGTAARTEFINENPDVIKAYIRALIKAAEYEQDNPDIQAAQFETTGQSKEDFEYLYNNYDYYWSVAPAEGEVEGFKAVLEFLIDNDLISSDKKFDIDEWINESFYEEAFKESGDSYRTIYIER